MKNVIFASYDGEIDPCTGVIYPNMCDKNYRSGANRRPSHFDSHMFHTTQKNGSYRKHILPEYKNVSYIRMDKIHTEFYFFIVNIHNVNFFSEMKDTGLSHVNPKIIEDANAGKCKIIFIQDTEGMSGLIGFPSEFDFKIIQDWCDIFNVNPDSVHYICGNLISDKRAIEQGCKCYVHPISVQETWNNVITFPKSVTEFNPTTPNYLYLNYNRQSRFHRVYMLSKLLKHNLFGKGMNSFNAMGKTANDVVFHLDQIEPGLDECARQLFDLAPIFVDTDNTNITSSAGDLSNYTETFISLITETLTESGTLFCSEKTWRSIIVGHPFMILGSTNALKYLKSQGFKTFDTWLDESYDDHDDLSKKINIIVANLERFNEMSVDELKSIRHQMEPILIHNKNHMIRYSQNKYYYDDTIYSHRKPVELVLSEIWKEMTKDNS